MNKLTTAPVTKATLEKLQDISHWTKVAIVRLIEQWANNEHEAQKESRK